MTKLNVISAASKAQTQMVLTTAARITPMTDITELPPKIGHGIRRRWHAQRGQRNGRGGRYQRLPSRSNLRKWIAKRLIAEVIAEAKHD